MADYFNIASNSDPNAYQEGYAAVLNNRNRETQNRLGELTIQDKQQQQDTNNQLRSLLPQAIGLSDPDQQTAMVKQLTAADPETGLKLQAYYQQQNAAQQAQAKDRVEGTLAYLSGMPDGPQKDQAVDGLIQKASASPIFADAAKQFQTLRQSGTPSQQVIYAMHNYLNSADAFSAPKVQDFKAGDQTTEGVWKNGQFVPVQTMMQGYQGQASPTPPQPMQAPQAAPQGQMVQMVAQAAQQAGLPVPLALAVASQESRFHANALSGAGAQGVMQVMPGTAAAPGFGIQPAQGNSPAENIRVGASYLAAMMQKYQGNRILALAAYNAGPQAVDQALQRAGGDPARALSLLPAETRAYIPGVLGRMQQFAGMGAAPSGMQTQQTPQMVLPPSPAGSPQSVQDAYTAGAGQLQASPMAPAPPTAPVAPALAQMASEGPLQPPAPQAQAQQSAFPAGFVTSSKAEQDKPPADYRWTDATHTRVEPIPGGPKDMTSQGGGATADNPLAGLDAADAAAVTKLASGTMLPSDFGLRSTSGMSRQELLGRAALLNPNWSPDWARAANSFMQGLTKTGPTSPGGQVDSANTIAQHLNQLIDADKALNANMSTMTSTGLSGSSTADYVRNAIMGRLSGSANKSISDWNKAAQLVTQEIQKLVKAGVASEAETKMFLANLSVDQPPESRASALADVARFALGRVQPLEQQRDNIFGPLSPKDSLLGTKEQQAIQNALTYGGQAPADLLPANQGGGFMRNMTPTLPTQGAPQSGTRVLKYDPATGTIQ